MGGIYAEGIIRLWPLNERTRPVLPSLLPFPVSPELLDQRAILAVAAARVAGIPATCYSYFGIDRETAATRRASFASSVITRACFFTTQHFRTCYGVMVDPVFRVVEVREEEIAAMIALLGGAETNPSSLDEWATQVDALLDEMRSCDEGEGLCLPALHQPGSALESGAS